MQKTCEYCGKSFYKPGHPEQKYCSKSCYSKSMVKQKVKRICAHCGKSFSDPKHPKKKYCSQACFNESVRNPKMAERKCVVCGGLYQPLRLTQKYCSSKCFGQDHKFPDPICEICKKPFKRTSNSKNRFCSYECMRKVPSTGIEVTCETCGKLFVVCQARYRTSNTRFCSRKCKSEAGKTWLTCEYCGKTVKVRRHIVESDHTVGRFCSLDCANKWQKGPNSPHWKGGHHKWRGPNWVKQKNKARKRDNYTCQHCGITENELGRPMDVHHIKPWREFKNDYKKANQLSNLICYCPSCHTTLERCNHSSQSHQSISSHEQLSKTLAG